MFNQTDTGRAGEYGPQVNTDGNEAFPFIHERVTFLPPMDTGYGALDLFMIEAGQREWGGNQLGEPFNSKADDLGIILNPDGDIGYFSLIAREGMAKTISICSKRQRHSRAFSSPNYPILS